jgi:branched-chain amino acid transport system substrate-binding protein
VNGNLADQNAVRAALKKAAFTSVRGPFKFNVNGYPIEDFYLTKVAKRPDDKYETQVVEKIFSNHADGYAKDCKAQ